MPERHELLLSLNQISKDYNLSKRIFNDFLQKLSSNGSSPLDGLTISITDEDAKAAFIGNEYKIKHSFKNSEKEKLGYVCLFLDSKDDEKPIASARFDRRGRFDIEGDVLDIHDDFGNDALTILLNLLHSAVTSD